MSYNIINGKVIETLDEPPFSEPKPVTPKKKSSILFAEANGTIHLTIEEIDQNYKSNLYTILGKRKLSEAFIEGNLDEERYGQLIKDDFFKTNIGHGVINIMN